MITFSDVTLLLKKILIGILVAVIPFVIIFGGLWITRRVLGTDTQQVRAETKSSTP
ncbi:MAG: hypothetical protein QM762_17255 [Chryseolinea sp.]